MLPGLSWWASASPRARVAAASRSRCGWGMGVLATGVEDLLVDWLFSEPEASASPQIFANPPSTRPIGVWARWR